MTADYKIPPDWVKQIKEWGASTPSVAAVYLFGSRARGTHRETSDLDLAILVGAPDGEHLAEFTENKRRWQRELRQRLTGVTVNIDYAGAESDCVVAPAVAHEGVPIYVQEECTK